MLFLCILSSFLKRGYFLALLKFLIFFGGGGGGGGGGGFKFLIFFGGEGQMLGPSLRMKKK